VKGLKVIKPLNYIEFSKSQAINHLQLSYGWKPYPQKHFESRFTRFLEGYWLPARFGFDPRRVQLSSLILTDQMSRDEALKVLEEPALIAEEVDIESTYIAGRLGISKEELQSYFEMPKKFYWDYKNQKSFLDSGARAMRLFRLESSIKR
jgi:hypothetical protein